MKKTKILSSAFAITLLLAASSAYSATATCKMPKEPTDKSCAGKTGKDAFTCNERNSLKKTLWGLKKQMKQAKCDSKQRVNDYKDPTGPVNGQQSNDSPR